MLKNTLKHVLLLFMLAVSPLVCAQVYVQDFGNGTSGAAVASPFTGAPATIDASLSNSKWTTSASGFIYYGGSTGTALSLSNSSGSPTYTLSFTVAPGKQLSITSFNFWRQRSNTGAQNWSMSVNGTPVGSGSVPTSGSNIGVTNVSTPVTGLMGDVSIVLSLSGASGTGTFRLDDFTLNGAVTASLDFDGDGVLDAVDLDDDNDGILDTAECDVTLAETSFNLFAPPCYSSPNETWNINVSGASGTSVTFNGSNYTIPASGALLISINGAAVPDLTDNVVETGKSLLLTSSNPVTLVHELTGGALSDSWVVIPQKTWGTNYRLFSYTYAGNAVNNQYAMIYSATNANQVVIKDKTGVVQKTFTLNAGETYLQAGLALDMTGWTVTSTAKVGVIVGVRCANSGVGACDNIDEMLLPTSMLGTKYYIPKGASNTTYVMADQANTTVNINGVLATTLVNAGDVYSFPVSTSDLKVVEASAKVSVWQLNPNNYDPAWCLVLDENSSVKSFNFTVPSSMTISNVLSLIVPTASTSLVTYNGNPVIGWVPYPSEPAVSYVEISGITAGASISISSTTGQVPILSSYTGRGGSISNSTAPSIGNYNVVTGQQMLGDCADNDGDGQPDYADLDSDGDGCSDANEAYGLTTAQGADGNWYYGTGNPPAVNADGTVVGASYAAYNSNVTTPGSASTVSTQPVNTTAFVGGNATISVTAIGGSGTTQYQWQLSTNNGSTWGDITNGGVYSNATTASLTITGATAAMNGYDYRVIITQSNYVCGMVMSNAVNLCVVSQADAATDPLNSACANVALVGNVPVLGTGAWSIISGTGGSLSSTSTATTTFTGTPEATYTVRWTITNGSCNSTDDVTFTLPAAPAIAVSSQTNIACFGGATGAINITASGGTAPYTYNWGGGVTTEDRTNIAAGTYTVTVTDATGCTATKTVTVTQPASALSATATVTGVSCFGGSNGTATATVTGGTPPYTYSWSPVGGTAATASGLVAGTYTVTVTDANNCTTTATAIVTQPAALAGTTVVTNVACFGGSSGAINLTVTGGTAPYTYNWGGGITTEDRTGLASGTYSVTITDANSCTTTVNAAVTQPAVALAASTVAINVSCFGGSNGAINLTVTGGTAPYTYNWGGGVTTEDRTGLASGTYNVTITDANNCTTTATATISQPAAALAGATVITNVSCFGGSNGAINLTVTGGTAPYTYNWGSGVTTEDRTGLSSGTYTVTITDANGCTATVNATVSQPAAALAASTVVTNVSCFGGSNGTINLTVTGGTAPYTYNWGGGVTTEDRTGLTSGTYNVTVTDGNGCTTTATATVTQPAAALAGTTVVTNVSCFGGSNGAINLTVTGGTAPYTYNWGGGVTTEDRTGLTSGTYSVTVTDANSCTTIVSATVAQPAAALAGTTAVTNVSCFGGSNGAIDLTVTGGTAPYTYNWGGGITTQDRTGLASGTYSVTITDANSCTTTVSATVTQPTALTATAVQNTPATCAESTNGGATVTAAGGTAPYTYLWDNSATTATVTNLSVGSHTVTVTDANSCTVTATVVISFSDTVAPVPTVATLPNITAQCEVTAADVPTPTATDNCVGAVTATNNAVYPITLQGTTVITWTYTDVNGNTATQTQNVVIDDTTAPVPTVANLPVIAMQCQVLATDVPTPSATDNCTGAVTVTTDAVFPITQLGDTVITWTFTDVNGNASTQAQTITVTQSALNAVTFTGEAFTYNTAPQGITVDNLPAGATAAYSITPDTGLDNMAVNAGTYTVTAVVTPAPNAPNCDPVTLTASFTINPAPQEIIFDPLAVMNLETDPDFQLTATATSGLPVTYTYTFTSANPPATVTAEGWVDMITSGEVQITASQEGNANYLPAEPVTQTLVITSSDSSIHNLVIDGVEYTSPSASTYYLMACENTANAITVSIATEANATVNPGHSFTINTPAPGIYHQTVVVTSQDGTTTTTYEITVERMFPFFDIVEQKFDNVLLANNNPANNGGYTFVAYKWYKNGQLVSTKQYFSEGPTNNDLLDPDAEYYLRLTTADGQELQTCVAHVTLEHNYRLMVTPNPARVSGQVTVTVDFPAEEINNMQIHIFDMLGRLVHSTTTSQRITTIQLPDTIQEATYLVKCTTANREKTFKLIVSHQ